MRSFWNLINYPMHVYLSKHLTKTYLNNATLFLNCEKIIIILCYVSVVTFMNPIQALSALLLAEHKFHLVITDLYLPDIFSGLQFIRRVRDEFKLPLIGEETVISHVLYILFAYVIYPKS